MSTINVLGTILDIDLFDVDVYEGYEKALTKTTDMVSDPKSYEGMSNAEQLRFQCEAIDEFLDEVFGEGTAETVFGNTCNLKDHLEVFGTVCSESSKMREELEQLQNKFPVFTAPTQLPNRQQRRYAEFHGQKGNKGRG